MIYIFNVVISPIVFLIGIANVLIILNELLMKGVYLI